jgi:hypothetical protein
MVRWEIEQNHNFVQFCSGVGKRNETERNETEKTENFQKRNETERKKITKSSVRVPDGFHLCINIKTFYRR